jgi:hypothetical protein
MGKCSWQTLALYPKSDFYLDSTTIVAYLTPPPVRRCTAAALSNSSTVLKLPILPVLPHPSPTSHSGCPTNWHPGSSARASIEAALSPWSISAQMCTVFFPDILFRRNHIASLVISCKVVWASVSNARQSVVQRWSFPKMVYNGSACMERNSSRSMLIHITRRGKTLQLAKRFRPGRYSSWVALPRRKNGLLLRSQRDMSMEASSCIHRGMAQ